MNQVIDAANKTFIAMKNPYGSVTRVFPQALEQFRDGNPHRYIGVKDKVQVPRTLIEKLQQKSNYILHTIDQASIGGRAIDVTMVNPLSGKPMTGSSSGTAVNVLLGINDLGIGTDGGGSVLAPAMSLNLFGFISPLIEQDYVQLFSSTSTDGIPFSVSLGFITREFPEMKEAIELILELPSSTCSTEPTVTRVDSSLDLYGPREPLIAYLKETLPLCDFFISEEGPVDLFGFGDSVLGHLGEATGESQRAAKKGFVRVVNMANATALVIPKRDFATAFVLICESTLPKIKAMLTYAETLAMEQDPLVRSYFQKIQNYYSDGYGGK